MFTTIIVKPLFNLLVSIYALIPGHNFGLAIIIFTLIVRLVMWPLVQKQLRQARVMRELQPELKKIKKQAAGDRQKESAMLMALYKEKGVNPIGSIGILIPQFIILFGLYDALRQVASNPKSLLTLSYSGILHLSWMQTLATNIHRFDDTLFGFVNLSKSATGHGAIYWPAMIIVLASAIAQYFQSTQLMPTQKDAKKLRDILREAGKSGAKADQSEVSAAVTRSTRFLLPVMIFLVTVNLPAALSLYWLTGGVIAFAQQWFILHKDERELEAIADTSSKDLANIPEGEVVTEPESEPLSLKPKKPKKNSSKNKAKKKRKRR
ncbi:MAG: YidC/Oxa1 family membrane protein insertase [Candidatus Saccharimonadales bacterium]